ncbi:MAG: tetratricopeptide repeat protein [Pyrinomonadaceae bacterium]
MRFFSFAIVFLFLAFVFAGCSRNSSDVNANQTADQGPQYTDANQALADGTALLDEGETDRAIEVLNQAVKINPDLADAYFRLGIAYALVESRDAAIIEEDVNAENSKPEKAKKSNSVIAFERAIDGYKKIVAANKEDHAAYFNMGRAFNKLNKDEDAENAFQQAVKLNPEETEYQTELGKILIKLARYREAIGPLKKALEIDPENVEAQEYLEDAEAGRSRVNYTSTPKTDNKNSNTNANVSGSNTSSANSAETPKPVDSNNPATTPRPTPSRALKSIQ